MSFNTAVIENTQPNSLGQRICATADIPKDTGVCALVNGHQVALFRTHDDCLFALDDFDPYANASVLSRGLIGETQGRLYVASPMYKHRFDLVTGACLDGDVNVRVWQIREVNGKLYCKEISNE